MVRFEVGHPKFTTNPSDVQTFVLMIKTFTPIEASKRLAKSLCYDCDERYTPDHKCKTQKLFWVEENEEDLSPNLVLIMQNDFQRKLIKDFSKHFLLGKKKREGK